MQQPHNVGYRYLGAKDSDVGIKSEKGFVGGLEYLIPIGLNASLTPFIEVAKFNNLRGGVGYDAVYYTTSLLGKYDNWRASITNVIRNSKNISRDKQLEYTVGYNFTKNISLDLT